MFDTRPPRRIAICVLALLLTLAGPASGQEVGIRGRVSDATTGQPVSGALVEVMGSGTRMRIATADDGSFRALGLPVGTFEVRVTSLGYAEATRSGVVVGAGRITTVDVAMTPSALGVDTLIVSVSRRVEKSVAAPAATSVVSGRDIESRPTLTPMEHIRSVPGVSIASTGLNQSRVSVRGFNNALSNFDRLLILMDNRNTHIPALRHNITQFLPFTDDDVERMEVVMGPGSALYGPNAANGVLHVITKSPFDSPGSSVTLGLGEREVFTGAFRHAAVVSDRVAYKISGQWYQGRDWPSSDPAEPDSVLKGVYTLDGRQNQSAPSSNARNFDIENQRADARIDIRTTDDSRLVLSGGLARLTSLNIADVGALQHTGWLYGYGQARFSTQRFFAQAFYNRSHADNDDTFLRRTGDLIVDKSGLFVVQAQHSTSVGERIELDYGLDVYLTRPNTGFTIHGRFEDSDNFQQYGLYLQSELALSDRLALVLAGRVDQHSELDERILSPRAAVVFSPSPDHTLRATYNRAFTTPSSPQLFLDLNIAESLGPLPFGLRGLRTPSTGYNFRREASGGVGGLFMQSPFNPRGRSEWLPAEATQMWPIIQALLASQGTDISGIPAPSPTEVATILASLNTQTFGFDRVDPSAVADITAPEPGITNTLEVGYKGAFGGRWYAAGSVYYSKVENFISPLVVQTPNVFFDGASLTSYLSGFMPAAEAGALAGAIAGIPVGTVTPEEAGALNPADIIFSFSNFVGDVSLWGAELQLQYTVNTNWRLEANYSYASKDLFPAGPNQPLDIALNAPRNKVAGSALYRSDRVGLDAGARVRYVDAFPVLSGVYQGTVDAFTVMDLNASWRLPFRPSLRITAAVQNLFDNRHVEYIGTPEIGRLAMIRLTQSF